LKRKVEGFWLITKDLNTAIGKLFCNEKPKIWLDRNKRQRIDYLRNVKQITIWFIFKYCGRIKSLQLDNGLIWSSAMTNEMNQNKIFRSWEFYRTDWFIKPIDWQRWNVEKKMIRFSTDYDDLIIGQKENRVANDRDKSKIFIGRNVWNKKFESEVKIQSFW